MSKKHPNLLGYLSVQDVLVVMRLNKSLNEIVIKKKFVKKIVRFGNLNSGLRTKFWNKLCYFSGLEDSLREELGLEDGTISVYAHILDLIKEESIGEKSIQILNEKVIDEISRDLKRTHTSERMRTIEG